VVAIAMLASTTMVMERWLRRSDRLFQFHLSTLLAITAIVGILLGLGLTFPNPRRDWGPFRIHSNFYLPPAGSSPGFPWYVSAALIFGLGCTIYTAGWLAVRACARAMEWLAQWRQRRSTTRLTPSGR
jgi:hypothetical protein